MLEEKGRAVMHAWAPTIDREGEKGLFCGVVTTGVRRGDYFYFISFADAS